MRKTSLFGLIAMLCASGLASQPAAAHEANVEVIGGQYLFYMPELPPDGGPMRFIGTPAGPVDLGQGPSADDIQQITNRDPVDHTFTECTASCDEAAGSSEGARFDIELPAGGSVLAVGLPAGDLTIMCTIHTWMRAQIRVNG